MRKTLLAVSMGDPAGIGPEVLVKAVTVPEVRRAAAIVVFGDRTILERSARLAHQPIEIVEVGSPEEVFDLDPDRLAVIAVSDLSSDAVTWGSPTLASDRAQVDYIKYAAESVISRKTAALVTGPVCKESLVRAGAKHLGHTPMLGEMTGVSQPIMMLAGPSLRVVPLTIHLPLKEVAAALSPDLLRHTLRVLHESFRQSFGIPRPRIAVAGLNPHAGEGGLLGSEEIEWIGPVVRECLGEGITVTGPLSADSVYYRAFTGEFDVVVGMYHDQALIPLKMVDFDRAVNVTLGLPIVRTSVDHGTAYDLAGQGIASANSMVESLLLAQKMAETRRSPPS